MAAALKTLPLSPRAAAAADKLAAAAHLRVHVVGNDPAVDFAHVLVAARVAFKAATATAALHRVRFDADKPSRMSDYSF